MTPGDGSSRGLNECSAHPDDVLMRELIRTGRQATPEEVERIVNRVATAVFNPAPVRVPTKERGLSYQGITLEAQAPSIEYHLVKRVMVECQWADGTTTEQYVDDLRRVALYPPAMLAIYQRHGEHHVMILADTKDALPVSHLGSRPEPATVVIYSADRGIIVTGYQALGLETLNIPKELRWLR